MGGRGLGQPAAGREGMVGTSTCDGEGEGTASCREGRYNRDQHMSWRGGEDSQLQGEKAQ